MNILKFIKTHKIFSLIGLIVLCLLAFLIFRSFNSKKVEASYSVSQVKKEDFIVSVSGSNQLSATDKIDLSAKSEGDLVNIYVIQGEDVKKGDVLAKIDSKSYDIEVNEAYIAYEVAKLELEELISPVDDSTIVQAENSLKSTQEELTKTKLDQESAYKEKDKEKEKLENNLISSYEDAYNNVSDTFLDFSDIINQLYKLIFSYEITENQNTFKQMNYAFLEASFKDNDYEEDRFSDILDDLEDEYNLSKEKYDASFATYESIGRYSDKEKVEGLLNETIDALRQSSDALKTSINMLDLWSQNRSKRDLEVFSIISNYETSLKNYLSKTNSHLTTLLNALNNIEENKQSIESLEDDLVSMNLNYPISISQIERSIDEKENNLNELKEGATELEIKNKELAVSQKLNSYKEALKDLNNCKVVAPFDGSIAEINSSIGDELNIGDSIFTIITHQKMIEIPLNEIDVAKVKTGQKAIITFDAVEGESFTGEVVEVDVLGEVDQGVVSYNAKIVFDTENELVKIGMTGNVEIVIYENAEALTVPVNSVKTFKENSFVEVLLSNGEIERKNIKIGESNDISIEVLDGLNENDKIIVSGNGETKKTTTNNSNFLMPTGGNSQRMMMR